MEEHNFELDANQNLKFGWIVELEKIAERCFCDELIKCAGMAYVRNHLSYPGVLHQQIQWARLSQTLTLIPSTTEMKQWGRKEGGKEGAISEETDWISPVRH